MTFHRTNQEESGFQMAPMIDIIFTLLLFYIVTTALQQNEKDLRVALPQAVAGQRPPRTPAEIVINVTESGEIIVQNEKISPEKLKENLQQLEEFYRNFQIPNVIVRGDKKADYGYIVQVLDICAQAKMHNVSFVAVERER